MSSISRRQLANYAVAELTKEHPSPELAKHLAAALTASGRQKEVDLLLADIDRELESRGLLAQALITTAHPLPDKLAGEVKRQLKALTKAKDVELSTQLDKTLLGGLKVETAIHSWNRTISRQLQAIREAI